MNGNSNADCTSHVLNLATGNATV